MPPRRRTRPLNANGEPVPRGRPLEVEKEEPVGTIERYSHKNEDGSFTFGYISADGSFKEETRGSDCITRGKYGYIDPEGVKREYTYTAGLPCEIGAEGENELAAEDGSVEDPVNPDERFRQTQNVQLSEDEIPEPARRQRVRQRTQAATRPAAAEPARQNAFANFGANSQAARVPARRPVPARTGGGSALDNLLTIADGGAAAVQPTRLRPKPAAPANPGTFDFDSELEGFTLNRPSLTFDKSAGAAAAAGNTGAAFQSQLVFDQNTGTFQTELRQAGQPVQANAAAPFVNPTAAPTTTVQATPRPTTVRRPAPTPAGVRPAATFSFEPLNISPVPPPTTAAPAPASPASPATVRLPPPTPAAPRPTTVLTSAPAARPAAPAVPAAQRPAGQAPANTFFVFQPFNQQGAPAPSPRPASQPFATPFNPNAFQIRPGQAGAAAPRPAGQPQPLQPFPQRIPAAAPAAAAPARPAAPAAPARPAAPAPAPQFRQPAPVPSQTFPGQPAAARPQLQFGFQPVQQAAGAAARPAPFTAFRSGPPPQIQALGQPQQLRQPAQLGVPPQLQGAQRFAPPQQRPQTFFGQAPQNIRGA